MASVEPQRLRLKSGEVVVVRSATPDDAPAVVAYLRRMAAGTRNIVSYPDEFKDEDEQRRAIAEQLERDDRLTLVAEPMAAPGRIVGELTFRTGNRRRVAHWGEFGISVDEAHRGQGLGRVLIEMLVEWARSRPSLEKINLSVLHRNDGARRLYRSLGFVEEGVRRRHVKHEDGSYDDDVQMTLWLKPPGPA